MALELSFTITEQCPGKQLTFVDTTGTYNVTTNPTGWGTPNTDITDCHSGELVILDPNSVTTTIDIFATGDFPNGGTTNSLVVLNTDLGLTEDVKLADGLWTFTVNYYGDDTTELLATKTVYKLFYCKAECCVESLFAKIPTKECSCEDEAVDNAMFAKTMLEALKYAARAGNTSRFDNLLIIVNDLCASDCGCGC